MSKTKKIIISIGIALGILLISNYVKAASASISATPNPASVGDTITITANVNAAQWDLEITCNGQSLERDYELENGKGNLTRSFSATYTATKEGTLTFHLVGDHTDTDYTNTEIDEVVNVTVNPKQEEPTPEPEPEPTPDPTPEQTPEEPTKPTYTVSEASGTFYVTASSVFVREGPGTNYERVGSLTKDAEVTRTGVSGSWTRISYNGREAFISSEYLTSTKPVEEEPEENENENENTIANEVANEMTNETTNETTNQEKVNEITGTTVDGEQAIDENSELQLKTLAIEGVDTSSIFKPGIYEYNINVSKDVKQLEITAVANQKDASVEILGNEDFVEGENIVTIMLKSADGEETATYQLIVNVGAATAEEGFPFVAVLGIIAGIIVVAIIVLIVLMVRNRRNAQWDEDEEDWEEPEELNTTYNTPDFTNQEDDDEEEFSTKNKRGKHF